VKKEQTMEIKLEPDILVPLMFLLWQTIIICVH